MSTGAHTAVLSAEDRLSLVVDPGSFEPWDEEVVSGDPLRFCQARPYGDQLAEARKRTGATEAVRSGRATLNGRPLAVVASEFGFLGGSIGVATGERITRAAERAQQEGIPLVAMPASGGSRMQEGSLALLQMAKITGAIRRLLDSGGCYVVYLTHPVTGGVLASWASLGLVTFAMPEALIGFAGPRVAELVTGRRLPRDVQTAEHMQQLGLIDAVVDRADLRGRLSDVIAVATGRRDARPGAADGSGDRVAGRRGARSTTRARPMVAPETAWTAVQHSRHPERPSAADLLEAWAGNLTPVREGGRGGADDAGCLVALAQLWGVPVVVVAQARDRQRGVPASLSPAGYRKARRGCALASRLGLPLVTIVDTPGAEISPEAEEGGLSREIAFCLSELGVVASPTLAVLLGEGGSGGALALMTADRVVCAENATLEVIAPEGASAILHRSIDHAAEMAASQAGSSWELARWGIVDVVVPEDPPAHLDPGGFIDRLGAAVESELQSLLAIEPAERLAARAWRYRNIDRLQEERG